MNFPQSYETALYVGDLAKDVTENMLLEKFASVGNVASVRICMSLVTKESLGYGYVNFLTKEEAARAIEIFNFDTLNGKPMRVMWSQRDSFQRKTGAGNIFIKNLEQSIDSKSLYDTFSAFGNILSCKVETNEWGISKGYGFIQYKTEEEALIAIEKVNGMLICGKKVYVGKFKTRREREKDNVEKVNVEIGNVENDVVESDNDNFTSVFIKNFGELLDEAKLYEMFCKFGNIKSHTVMRKEDGTSKGFGFVNFEDSSAAAASVLELNNTEVGGETLFVGRALKKDERQKIAQSGKSCNQSANLYVKNLDDIIDDEILRKMFSPYGTITSAKIMKVDGLSKGFGFVCFSSHEEAIRALTKMNKKFVGNKPLYVALAQSKEDRKIKVASQIKRHRNTLNQMFQTNATNAFYNMPNATHPQIDVQPQISTLRARWPHPIDENRNETQTVDTAHAPTPMYPVTRPNGRQIGGPISRRYLLRSFATNGGPATVIRSSRPVLQTVARQYISTHQESTAPSSFTEQAIRSQPITSQAVAGEPSSTEQATKSQHAANQAIGSRLSTTQQDSESRSLAAPQAIETQYLPTQQATTAYPSEAITDPTEEPLTASILTDTTPQERKLILGERLYPLVKKLYPEFASKITGMLLEIDNDVLLQLLKHPNLIKEKADDAFSVLEAHGLTIPKSASKND